MTNSTRPTNAKDTFARILWAYRGRRTPLPRLAQSIVPVSNKEEIPTGDLLLSMPIQDPNHEDWIMDIQGTAFQVGEGKLLTCWHACEKLRVWERQAYYYANSRIGDHEAQRPYPVAAQLNFVDPRTDAGNPLIDVGMLISPVIHWEKAPYLVPKGTWGDSTWLGVGDRVVIGLEDSLSAATYSSRRRPTAASCSRRSSRASSARSSRRSSRVRVGCCRSTR